MYTWFDSKTIRFMRVISLTTGEMVLGLAIGSGQDNDYDCCCLTLTQQFFSNIMVRTS
jgi:hypothetical protein